MNCVVISDTHGKYREINIPVGDILIHAGDITCRGTFSELEDFNEWLGTLTHTYEIIIAGNHDWCFEQDLNKSKSILTNGIYLQDDFVNIQDIKFYGSPWQPYFFNWAFNLARGNEIKEKWKLIPKDTDILITHGPAFGVLDKVVTGESVGCEELKKIIDKIHPRYHIFGHIHEGYGVCEINGVRYINASINTERYKPVNDPICFNLK